MSNQEEFEKQLIEDRAAANYWRAYRKNFNDASLLERRVFRVGAAFEMACGL